MTPEIEITENASDVGPPRLPMSHVSVEVGHLYFEDLQAGPDALDRLFAGVKPWFDMVTGPRVLVPTDRPRISTCFLIDDYFSRFLTPREILPKIIAAAQRCDVGIDYVSRESACAAGGLNSPAQLMVNGFVNEPTPGTTGGRPPPAVTGWLANGRRSPEAANEAMAARLRAWVPPEQTAARRHSIHVDVELWSKPGEEERLWSCPALAAAWQLLRLGLLRDRAGRPPIKPVDHNSVWPASWDALPALIRLNPNAKPFQAYTTFSVLSPRFLPVEVAVRTILEQYAPATGLTDRTRTAAEGEGIRLADELVDWIRYAFVTSGTTDPA